MGSGSFEVGGGIVCTSKTDGWNPNSFANHLDSTLVLSVLYDTFRDMHKTELFSSICEHGFSHSHTHKTSTAANKFTRTWDFSGFSTHLKVGQKSSERGLVMLASRSLYKSTRVEYVRSNNGSRLGYSGPLCEELRTWCCCCEGSWQLLLILGSENKSIHFLSKRPVDARNPQRLVRTWELSHSGLLCDESARDVVRVLTASITAWGEQSNFWIFLEGESMLADQGVSGECFPGSYGAIIGLIPSSSKVGRYFAKSSTDRSKLPHTERETLAR